MYYMDGNLDDDFVSIIRAFSVSRFDVHVLGSWHCLNVQLKVSTQFMVNALLNYYQQDQFKFQHQSNYIIKLWWKTFEKALFKTNDVFQVIKPKSSRSNCCLKFVVTRKLPNTSYKISR